jgi:hypothetical protein
VKENQRWGYEKIQGELLNIGYRLSVSFVRNTLKLHAVTPVSQRSTGSWRSFLGHYKDQIPACDLFTVETIWFKTIYVLCFIELGTRKIYGSGCTTNSDRPGLLIGVDDTIRIKAGEYIGIIQLVPDLNEFISTEVAAVKFR